MKYVTEEDLKRYGIIEWMTKMDQQNQEILKKLDNLYNHHDLQRVQVDFINDKLNALIKKTGAEY